MFYGESAVKAWSLILKTKVLNCQTLFPWATTFRYHLEIKLEHGHFVLFNFSHTFLQCQIYL